MTLADGRTLDLVREESAFAAACARSGVIVTSIEAETCANAVLIGGRDLARRGGAMIYADCIERATPDFVRRLWTTTSAAQQ